MTITPHRHDESTNTPYDNSSKQGLKQGLNVFAGTRCGWYHKKNEDYLLYDLDNGFFGLADGVGGGQMGDVASESLLRFLHAQHQSLPSAEQIIHDLKAGDVHIQNILANHQARGATTAVVAWLDSNAKGFISSVGDARIYLLDIVSDLDTHHTKTHLTQLTTDQTYENLGVPTPEGRSPDDPIRMIGVGAVGDPPVQEIQLHHNQALFLCSDGIHKFLTTEQMQEIFGRYLIHRPDELPLESLANALIKEAVNHGSHDDCSVVVVFYCDDELIRLNFNEDSGIYKKSFNIDESKNHMSDTPKFINNQAKHCCNNIKDKYKPLYLMLLISLIVIAVLVYFWFRTSTLK